MQGIKLKMARIVSTYFIHCRRCYACSKGKFWLCKNPYYYWAKQPEVAPHFHVIFGTHWYVQLGHMFYKIPDEVSDKASANSNCALSQVYFGLDMVNLTFGDTLVIQEAGELGIHSVAVAKE